MEAWKLKKCGHYLRKTNSEPEQAEARTVFCMNCPGYSFYTPRRISTNLSSPYVGLGWTNSRTRAKPARS